MGLLGFWNKSGGEKGAAPPFRFRIDDVFTIKTRGVVVTGQVTMGQVKKGTAVSCGDGKGPARFSCVIGDIEYPAPKTRQPVHPETARADGPFQGSCALLISDRGPEDFRSGDYLFLGNG